MAAPSFARRTTGIPVSDAASLRPMWIRTTLVRLGLGLGARRRDGTCVRRRARARAGEGVVPAEGHERASSCSTSR
jgi:hypothetical protein